MWFVGAVLWGCGSSAPKAVVTPIAPREATADSGERSLYTETLRSLDAAPEPDGVWLHFHSPSELWKRVPLLARDFSAFSPLKSAMANEVMPPDVAAVVDLSQPVDVAWPMDPSVRPVWAFRLRSEQALQHGATGLTLRRTSPGVWDIGSVVAAPPEDETAPETSGEAEADVDSGEPESWEPEPESTPRCRLFHAPAPVGYRVLCAMGGLDGLDQSRAFLLEPARTTALAELHVEVAGPSYAALRSAAAARMSLSSSFRSDTPLDKTRITGLVGGVGKALLEHERVSLDVSFAGERARAQVELAYPKQLGSARFQSWLALVSQAKLPATAAHLPADAGFALAFAGLGVDNTAYLFSEVTAQLDDEHIIEPKQLAELGAAMAGVVPADGHFALAFGADADAALSALTHDAVRIADDADRPLGTAAIARLNEALSGWTVLGLDVPPQKYLAAVQRLFSRRNLKLRYKPGKAPPPDNTSSEQRALPAPRGLPKDTVHWVERSRKKSNRSEHAAPAPLDFDRHVLFVPDDARVWIVISRSEGVAAQRARELLDHRHDFAWPDLGGAAPLAVSSFDLRSLALLDLDWDTKEQRAEAKALLSRINLAPHQAGLRVPARLSVVEGQAGYLLQLRTEADVSELMAQAFALVPASPED